jgi:cytochrome c553
MQTIQEARMKRRTLIFATMLSLTFIPQLSKHASSADQPPAWAYPITPPEFKVPPDNGEIKHVPDSPESYTVTQTRDRFLAKDWHPDDHPSMPEIVAYGRKPEVFACGHCHRPDGSGGPENSSLAGLPIAYFVQQIIDFKSGARRSAVPKRIPVTLMTAIAHAVTDDDVAKAAAYFAGLKSKNHINVIEASSVPKTYVAWLIYAASNHGGKEPIGNRIVEIPDNLDEFELYDSHAKFTAYVPIGSLAKGEALVTSGGSGKTAPCGICHGPDLNGLGPIPGIAGRSPSYIVRQLYDIKHGDRAGPWSPLMVKVVSNLNDDDLVSVAAYLASLTP